MRTDVPAPTLPLQVICGDLHNLGDLMLLMQNLSPTVLTDQRAVRIRRWQDLPDAIVRQVEHASGELVNGRALLSYALQCRGSDMVIGGGQLVRDNVSLRSLAGLALAAVLLRGAGGRITTRGLGVSRIVSRPRRILWRTILRRCDAINVRDHASVDHLKDLLPGATPNLTADMVLLPTSANQALREGGAARDAIVLAPCIDAGEDRLLELEQIDQLLAAAHEALPERRLVIACHDPRPAMDLAAAQEIAGRCRQLAPEIEAGYDLDALTGLYSRSRLVLTNRLHAMIFGLLAGSAIVLLEDGNPKLRDVAEAFGVPRIRRGQGRAAMASAIEAALAFDANERAVTLRAFADRAAGNLEPGPLPAGHFSGGQASSTALEPSTIANR